MRFLIALVVLLGTVDLNEGCIGGRKRPSRPVRRNPKLVQPTTQAITAAETTMLPEVIILEEVVQPIEERNEPTTAEATTRIPEIITTERVIQNQETTTIEPTIAEATTRTPEIITTERAVQNQETTTIEPTTAEATTTTRIEPATRPTSLFRFRSKTFGLKSIQSTENCENDIKGECKAPCDINEYVRGKFNCVGDRFCCVTRTTLF